MKLTRIIPIAVLLIALVLYGIFWQQKATLSNSSLMTASVTRGDIEQTVLATGTLKPSRLVAVGAQVSGRITSVKVQLGQEVTQGDLIAEIDSVTQANDLRTAEAALLRLKAQRVEKEATLKLNEIALRRQQKMLQQSVAAQADLESAEADVAITKAQIEAIDAQIIEGQVAIETAQANLGYTKITAPVDGTVLHIVSQEGQTVNAMQSAPTIVILGQLDVMTIRTEISEADIVRVKPGQAVYFTVLGDREKKYTATLEAIEPAPESITSDSSISSASTSSSATEEAIYYNGVFTIANPYGHLRTYMTAEVHIVLGQAKDVLLVPSAALTQDSTGAYSVRVVEQGNQLVARKVEIGLNDNITAEVRYGLQEGEQVVTGEAAQTSGSSSVGGPPPMGF